MRAILFCFVFMHIQASVWSTNSFEYDYLSSRQGRECLRHQCLTVFYFLFVLKELNHVGSGYQVCTFSHQAQCTWIKDGIRLVLVRRGKKGSVLQFACLFFFQEEREEGLMLSQSEKRLAKDLRRLRMVSAFTSSWLRLARGAGVSGMLKVLVRDWDLL